MQSNGYNIAIYLHKPNPCISTEEWRELGRSTIERLN
jgi:hypothetical protein